MKLNARKLLRTVTILNKVNANEVAGVNVDTWYKTTLNNCMWIDEHNALYNENKTQDASITKAYIPSANNRYIERTAWLSLSNKVGTFTLRNGDFLVIGDVTEAIDTSNVVEVVRNHKGIKVNAFEDLTFDNAIECGGVLGQFASMLYVEGR